MKETLTIILVILLAMAAPVYILSYNYTQQLNELKTDNAQLQEINKDLKEQRNTLLEQNTRLLEQVQQLLKINEDLRTIDVTTTGYAPFDNTSGICTDGDPTNTATGTYPEHGTIAVDPEVIPYGTEMYIPGYGKGTAEDTGATMRNATTPHIDLYFDTHSEAMAWGVQEKNIIILGF